ncbi:class I SAM-dependent methyltransferase [Amycolatopsis azurea]|uniref:class I SAM-dependent methyltransferase n=1 Tax=Amycolatopsis azurea TaxID=36819 RepID=UPI003830300C
MYNDVFADIYHQFYSARGRDYAAEADQIVKLAGDRVSKATSLLDVACGTGQHLKRFSEIYPDVEGVDLSEDMLHFARRELPAVSLHHGDMCSFDLGRRFDIATCLFSSVGHMPAMTELEAAVSNILRHVSPRGVLVLEPWWFPDDFIDGYVASDALTVAGRKLCRMSYSTLSGNRSNIEVHYLVADPGSAPRHIVDRTELTLFTRDQYEAAFRAAGAESEYVSGGPSGRGLFIGWRK